MEKRCSFFLFIVYCLVLKMLLPFSMIRLDVDIELLELNWVPISNHTGFENELQYQICCLDVDEITSRNPEQWQIPIHVWVRISSN